MLTKTVIFYTTENGKLPFQKWLKSLKDKTIIARVVKRFEKIEQGNYGDYAPVGNSVFELRYFFGAGYRVYFAEDGEDTVVILCGGDKDTQDEDIKTAKSFWKDYLSRKEDEND